MTVIQGGKTVKIEQNKGQDSASPGSKNPFVFNAEGGGSIQNNSLKKVRRSLQQYEGGSISGHIRG